MGFPEEAAFWTDDADGDPVFPAEPPAPADEVLLAVVFLRRQGWLVAPPIGGPSGEHGGLR